MADPTTIAIDVDLILKGVLGLVLAILTYFLKRLVSRGDKVEMDTSAIKVQLAEQNSTYLAAAGMRDDMKDHEKRILRLEMANDAVWRAVDKLNGNSQVNPSSPKCLGDNNG